MNKELETSAEAVRSDMFAECDGALKLYITAEKFCNIDNGDQVQ